MKALTVIKNVYEGIQNVINWLLAVMGIFMLITLTYQVVTRYVSPTPASWPTDTSTYILVAMGFLGMGWLLRHGDHVSVDLVVNYFPPKGRTVIALITSIVGTFSCAVIAYAAIFVTNDQYLRNVTLTGSVFNFPKYILLSFIAIGFVFTTIEFAREVYKYAQALKNKDYGVTEEE